MKALIIVDVQYDFLPGGALAVAQGEQIIPLINGLMGQFDCVVATQDFHPAGHGSFASQHEGKVLYEVTELNGLEQVLWPDHCIQGTAGAALSPQLNLEGINEVIPKGTDPGIDSYSGFFDNGRRKATGLEAWLRSKDVESVFVCGLATDYCVKFTALDAASLGFQTWLVEDACRGVELRAGDVAAALAAMETAGVRRVKAAELALGQGAC